MRETMTCKQCPAQMTVETVDGEKRWVCAECGYSMPYRKAAGLPAFKPWMAGLAAVAALFLYALFQ